MLGIFLFNIGDGFFFLFGIELISLILLFILKVKVELEVVMKDNIVKIVEMLVNFLLVLGEVVYDV